MAGRFSHNRDGVWSLSLCACMVTGFGLEIPQANYRKEGTRREAHCDGEAEAISGAPFAATPAATFSASSGAVKGLPLFAKYAW